MARIRTIKPEFWESEDTSRLSPLAALSFIGLVSLADDEGRGRADAVYLYSRLHHGRTVKPSVFNSALHEIEQAGLVVFYEDQQRHRYYWVVNFNKHQKIEKPSPSKLPIPRILPESSPTARGVVAVGMDQGSGIKDQGEDLPRRGASANPSPPARLAQPEPQAAPASPPTEPSASRPPTEPPQDSPVRAPDAPRADRTKTSGDRIGRQASMGDLLLDESPALQRIRSEIHEQPDDQPPPVTTTPAGLTGSPVDRLVQLALTIKCPNKPEVIRRYCEAWRARKGAAEVERVLMLPSVRGLNVLQIDKGFFNGDSPGGFDPSKSKSPM